MRVDSKNRKSSEEKLCWDDVPITFHRHFFRISGFILFFYVTSVKTKKKVVTLSSASVLLLITLSVFIYRQEEDWETELVQLKLILISRYFGERKKKTWNQYRAVLIFSSRSSPPSATSFNHWGRQDAKIKHVRNFHVQTSKNTRRKKKKNRSQSVWRPLLFSLSHCTRLFILAIFESAASCRVSKLTKVIHSWVRWERNVSKEGIGLLPVRAYLALLSCFQTEAEFSSHFSTSETKGSYSRIFLPDLNKLSASTHNLNNSISKVHQKRQSLQWSLLLLWFDWWNFT